MTFWMMDDQSKQVLARSVVHPFQTNHRVKWDPDLMDKEEKSTAIHGGDVKPIQTTGDSEILIDQDDSLEEEIPSTSEVSTNEPVFKQDYDNKGLDTTNIYLPKETGVTTRSKGKLKLDNAIIPLNESIDTFVRKRKKSYRKVKYKGDYRPRENHDGVSMERQRRSERLKRTTTFGPSKVTSAMLVNR